MKNLNVIILAAGQGTRMCSSKPKVLHPMAGRPLVEHVIQVASSLLPEKIYLVIGHQAEQIKTTIQNPLCVFIEQEKQLGTGHAVLQTLPYLDKEGYALVLYGDVPLIKESTLKELISKTDGKNIVMLTANMKNPKGLGRILRDEKGQVIGIVEEKDASSAQREITEINTGIMLIPLSYLKEHLPKLKNDNQQQEYYLTDLIAVAYGLNIPIIPLLCTEAEEAQGINNRIQLAQAERIYQRREAYRIMEAGVSLADPDRVDFRGDIIVGQDSFVDVNVVMEGKVIIGKNCQIGPFVHLKNVIIGDSVKIYSHTAIEEAVLSEGCSIGPYARLRPGTELKAHAKVGNFVEIKKSIIGEHSKINHLSYIGDAQVGVDVNIGAGTITCNYDGINKYKTIIEDGAFIGSDTQLVAPVTIGKGSVIGAGSTITKDTPADKLTLSRSKQTTVDTWQKKVKKH